MKTFAIVPLVLLLAGPASAQDAFKQVWVTQSDSGDVVRGRIVELSPQSLAILTADHRRVEMPLDHVLRIEARGDSLRNGAVIGAVVMGGLSLFSCQAVAGAGCASIVAFNAGFGALMGVGIDALNGGRTTLYRRPPAAAIAAVKVKLKL